MYLQTSQSRTWPKLFAARGDGPGTRILPVHRAPSRHSFPSAESEYENAEKTRKESSVRIEETCMKWVGDQEFLSQKIGQLKKASTNDAKALAGTMKEISNEIESFQELCNSRWFADTSKGSGSSKQLQQVTIAEEHVNILKSKELPCKVRSNSETHVTEKIPNTSGMRHAATQSSKLIAREQGKELQRQISKLNLSKEIVSPSRTAHVTNEKQVQKENGEMKSAVSRAASALTDVERQSFKMAVRAMSAKGMQEQNMETVTPNSAPQAQTSSEATKQFHDEFTEAREEVDESASALTDAERQTFKDAINAMHAETEREEKRVAKASTKLMPPRRSGSLRTSKEHKKIAGPAEKTRIWSSSSISKVNILENNRQAVSVEVVQSQAGLHKLHHVRRVSEVQIDKQKKPAGEIMMKREVQEKQKAVMYHGFLPPKLQPSTSTFSNIKNGNFQAGFVKAIPLETGVVHINPSVPLVSKHCATKHMPSKTPQRNLQRRSAQVK